MRNNKYNEGFFVTPEEHQALLDEAKRRSLSKSALIRLILFGTLPPIKAERGE